MVRMMDIGGKFDNFMKSFTGGSTQDAGLTEEEAKEMEDRFKSGGMSFDDFLKQVNMMQKAGSMQAMLQKSPFGGGRGGGLSGDQLAEGEKKLKRYSAFVKVMEPIERAQPDILIEEAARVRAGEAPERMQRIAEASDSKVEDIARFVVEFQTLRTAAQKFARGESPDKIKQEMMQQQEQVMPKNRAQRRQAARKKKGSVRVRAGGGGFAGR